MPPEPVVGWDVGGAHLKAARLDATGTVERVMQLPCPLWQGIDHLRRALDHALAALGPAAIHAVTMTGEMADLFPNRREGVVRLVAALGERLPPATLRCYAGVDGFVDESKVAGLADRVASANWMASAALVAACLPQALFIDVGSTTTDLVAVREGRVLASGGTDAERLLVGELLYTGVVRTPVMALAGEAPFAGDWVPVVPELFATAADVHRLTGRLPDAADQHPAADGGEKSVAGSARRLARMIGRDVESAALEDWRRLAQWFADAQATRIDAAWDRLLSRAGLATDAPVVVAGVGRFVATELARRRRSPSLDFGCLLSAADGERERATDCAPAVAVAWLAQRPDVSRSRAGGGPPAG